jgi:hypothetical protein
MGIGSNKKRLLIAVTDSCIFITALLRKMNNINIYLFSIFILPNLGPLYVASTTIVVADAATVYASQRTVPLCAL